MDDAMTIVAASGYGDRRFHLVGHDWGGSIAWALGARYPQRLASLSVLSRPHPNAFNRALQMPDGDQARRSRHHKAFLEPDAVDVVLADNAKWLRERWAANGVPVAAMEAHLSVLGNQPAMEAALAWYRARGAIRSPLGPIPRAHALRSGATPTTPSGGSPPKAPLISFPRPTASRCSPGSVILPPTRRRSACVNCCLNTSRPIRPDALKPSRPREPEGLEIVVLHNWSTTTWPRTIVVIRMPRLSANHRENSRSSTRPSRHIGPRILNDGPELPRSNLC